MKVGDLVKLHDTGWRYGGEIGILVKAYPLERTVPEKEMGAPEPYGFKVMLSRGRIVTKLRKQMEVVSESR